MKNNYNIESSHNEYLSLPDSEWRKVFFDETTGGYVATHKLKAKDTMNRDGVAKEVKACLELAKLGKHVLRLPENVLDKIDILQIEDRPYRLFLKFKDDSKRPRGYPDVYYDGKTWDFKTSTFQNEDSLRQTIKEGRKADNIIFIINQVTDYFMLEKAIKSEIGRRKSDGSWRELPNIYGWFQGNLDEIWIK